jgi:hypothetical protein
MMNKTPVVTDTVKLASKGVIEKNENGLETPFPIFLVKKKHTFFSETIHFIQEPTI